MKKILFLLLFVSNISFSQTAQELEAFGRLLNDAIFYCDRYITPASDASIYQASSGWISSPKKRKLWDVTLGFNNNIFFVPKSDRKFEIKNINIPLLEQSSITDNNKNQLFSNLLSFSKIYPDLNFNFEIEDEYTTSLELLNLSDKFYFIYDTGNLNFIGVDHYEYINKVFHKNKF